jgi:hypothetical protein
LPLGLLRMAGMRGVAANESEEVQRNDR